MDSSFVHTYKNYTEDHFYDARICAQLCVYVCGIVECVIAWEQSVLLSVSFVVKEYCQYPSVRTLCVYADFPIRVLPPFSVLLHTVLICILHCCNTIYCVHIIMHVLNTAPLRCNHAAGRVASNRTLNPHTSPALRTSSRVHLLKHSTAHRSHVTQAAMAAATTSTSVGQRMQELKQAGKYVCTSACWIFSHACCME